MALVVTMRKDATVVIGDQTYTVSEVASPFEFCLIRSSDHTEFWVDDTSWVFLDTNVSIMAGIPLNDIGTQVRLMIDAPKEVKILRGELID